MLPSRQQEGGAPSLRQLRLLCLFSKCQLDLIHKLARGCSLARGCIAALRLESLLQRKQVRACGACAASCAAGLAALLLLLPAAAAAGLRRRCRCYCSRRPGPARGRLAASAQDVSTAMEVEEASDSLMVLGGGRLVPHGQLAAELAALKQQIWQREQEVRDAQDDRGARPALRPCAPCLLACPPACRPLPMARSQACSSRGPAAQPCANAGARRHGPASPRAQAPCCGCKSTRP